MVTRILFDPRRDLTDGTTTSQPVTIEATPTGIAENGAVFILPATLTFTINTGADVFQLPASVASWAWRLVVKQSGTIKQQRTVQVPDVTSVQYQKLVDVNPATLAVTAGTARQWDATYAQLLALINSGSTGTGLTDAGVATLIQAPASATALALSATYIAKPSGGTTGQALLKQADGSTAWGTVASGGSTTPQLGSDGNYSIDSSTSSSVALGADGNYALSA